jgi:hypothetical protein
MSMLVDHQKLKHLALFESIEYEKTMVPMKGGG